VGAHSNRLSFGADSRFASELIQNVTSYNSSELVVLSWPKMKSCYFDLRPNSSAGYGANSPSILLNSTVRSTPITIGLADLSTTPTATSSPSSSLPATAASSTSSSTSSPPSSGSSNKNSHTGIGVGVGVGLGAAAVIAFVGFAIVYFFRRRSRNMARGAAVPDHDSQSDSQKWQWQQPPDHGVYMQPVNQKPHEMAAENMHELPADPGAHEMSHEGYDAAGGGAQQPKKEWRFSWEANQTPRA
jgi:hypothetical protein